MGALGCKHHRGAESLEPSYVSLRARRCALQPVALVREPRKTDQLSAL